MSGPRLLTDLFGNDLAPFKGLGFWLTLMII